MSATAGSIGYRQGARIEPKTWGPVAGLLALLLAAVLLSAVYSTPAQSPRVIERGVPFGRVAPAESSQVADLSGVLTQGPAFTAASDRAAGRAATRGGSVLRPAFGTRGGPVVEKQTASGKIAYVQTGQTSP